MASLERDNRADDVRVFDGAEDEEDVEGSRLPLLIVIALLVLAAFGAVVWLAYQRGVAQGQSEVPRTIVAATGPAKVAPTNAGGTPTPYTGLKIYQQPAPSDSEVDTAPPPADAKPAPATTPPETTAMNPPAPTPTKPVETAPPPKPVETAPPKPVASAPPAPAPVKPTPTPAKPAPTPAKPTQTAAVTPPPPAKPVETTPAPAPAATGGALLQIGSYKSQAEANAAWASYKAKHGGLVGGLSPDIKQVDLGPKGTWYRLRIGAGSRSEAASLCDKLKAQGGACIPTK